mgnify:CR=1 FL=1
MRQGVRTGKTLEEAVDEAISKSLKEGVLKDLLKKNRAEVRNVVLTEYNEELHLKNVRECGYEEGYDNGYGSGLDQGRMQNQIELVIKKVRKGQSLEQSADALETSEDQLKEIYEAVVKAAPGYDFERIQGELKIKKQE